MSFLEFLPPTEFDPNNDPQYSIVDMKTSDGKCCYLIACTPEQANKIHVVNTIQNWSPLYRKCILAIVSSDRVWFFKIPICFSCILGKKTRLTQMEELGDILSQIDPMTNTNENSGILREANFLGSTDNIGKWCESEKDDGEDTVEDSPVPTPPWLL